MINHLCLLLNADALTSTRSRFSSSRLSLHGSGVLTNQSDVPTTTTSVASLFQRSTCSPLRKFQLLDSDSEDNDHPSTSRVTKTNDSFSKGNESGSLQCSEHLCKDFSPEAMFKIQTPALDDVCQDYFSSIKSNNQETRQSLDFSPPSHRFFMHSDPRIQNLARQRLPNLLPLGLYNDKEVFLIDYMWVTLLIPFFMLILTIICFQGIDISFPMPL